MTSSNLSEDPPPLPLSHYSALLTAFEQVLPPAEVIQVSLPGVQFNRHLKFKAWVKARIKDKVKVKWLRLGLRLSKMSIEDYVK